MLSRIAKSPFMRKSLALVRKIPRSIKRLKSNHAEYRKNPPVLANSFPKSGTHLLLQIVEALPNLRNYDSFMASMPSFTFRERSLEKHLQLIHKILPGEVLPAHLFYHHHYNDALHKINCVHFFIYRDPRDVVISDAHYLAEMNRWHRMHKYYNEIDNWEDRVARAIIGFNKPNFLYDYPNVAERFSRYRGWLEAPDVFLVRYEDLISSNRRKFLQEIAAFYLKRCEVEYSIDDIVSSMEDNINPETSHTFRQGGSGGWKDVFTDRHKIQMKKVAGDLLIDLEYEQNLEW